MTKNQIINRVKEIILKYSKPNRIYLFGSQASGEATKFSDIDIAYDDKDSKNDLIIKDEINKIETLVKIDIKNIAKTGDRFANRVKSTAKILYSANKQLRAEDGLYNFNNALIKFTSALNIQNELIEDGFEDIVLDLIVKRFEFTYEMSWKALKRYLDFLGIEAKSPRGVFKEAYAQGILEEERVWLDMLEQRNISSHIYDEFEIREILTKVDKFQKAFKNLKDKIDRGLNEKTFIT